MFPREQFARHESQSKLGPSYSVWIPWDEVGGAQKHISLIARFEPHEGPLVVGEHIRHLLPGINSIAEQPASTTPVVQLARHSRSAEEKLEVAHAFSDTKDLSQPADAKPRQQVTSISLPKSWQHRLKTSSSTADIP